MHCTPLEIRGELRRTLGLPFDLDTTAELDGYLQYAFSISKERETIIHICLNQWYQNHALPYTNSPTRVNPQPSSYLLPVNAQQTIMQSQDYLMRLEREQREQRENRERENRERESRERERESREREREQHIPIIPLDAQRSIMQLEQDYQRHQDHQRALQQAQQDHKSFAESRPHLVNSGSLLERDRMESMQETVPAKKSRPETDHVPSSSLRGTFQSPSIPATQDSFSLMDSFQSSIPTATRYSLAAKDSFPSSISTIPTAIDLLTPMRDDMFNPSPGIAQPSVTPQHNKDTSMRDALAPMRDEMLNTSPGLVQPFVTLQPTKEKEAEHSKPKCEWCGVTLKETHNDTRLKCDLCGIAPSGSAQQAKEEAEKEKENGKEADHGKPKCDWCGSVVAEVTVDCDVQHHYCRQCFHNANVVDRRSFCPGFRDRNCGRRLIDAVVTPATERTTRLKEPQATSFDRPIEHPTQTVPAAKPEIPFVSERKSLLLLQSEYANDVIRQKITHLSSDLGFNSYRGIRGDGNCFYRALAVVMLETLDPQDLMCLGLNYRAQLDPVESKIIERAVSDTKMNIHDQELSQVMVKLLRKITSYSLLKQSDQYRFYFDSEAEFAARRVLAETMGEEAEHMEINALLTELKMTGRLFQLERNAGPLQTYTLPDDSQAPQFYLLYRPGHYDILYKA